MSSVTLRLDHLNGVLGLASRLLRRSPASVAFVVTVVYVAYVLWRLNITGGDPSWFIIAGQPISDPASVPPNVHVFPPGITYDGQFFYRLALQPWTQERTDYGIVLDVPAYRQQRILFPLLAWLVSAGSWQLTPLALILVNLMALATLAYSAAAYAVNAGRHALASIVVPFYPGYLISVSRDLAEVTEAALLVTGFVLVERRRYVLASVVLAAGMLARETLLIVPIAGVLVWAIRRARGQVDGGPPLTVWLTPLVAYSVWYAVLVTRWGFGGVAHGGYVNFGVPFDGLGSHLATIDLRATDIWKTDLPELGLLAVALAAVVAQYRWRLATNVMALACVLSAVAAVFYAPFVWQDPFAYLRALHELFLAASLALLAVAVWTTRVLGLATVTLWALFVVQHWAAP